MLLRNYVVLDSLRTKINKIKEIKEIKPPINPNKIQSHKPISIRISKAETGTSSPPDPFNPQNQVRLDTLSLAGHVVLPLPLLLWFLRFLALYYPSIPLLIFCRFLQLCFYAERRPQDIQTSPQLSGPLTRQNDPPRYVRTSSSVQITIISNNWFAVLLTFSSLVLAQLVWVPPNV